MATRSLSPTLTLAVGSTLGGFLGAGIGRRLKPVVLRTVIVILGVVALVNLLAKLFNA